MFSLTLLTSRFPKLAARESVNNKHYRVQNAEALLRHFEKGNNLRERVR